MSVIKKIFSASLLVTNFIGAMDEASMLIIENTSSINSYHIPNVVIMNEMGHSVHIPRELFDTIQEVFFDKFPQENREGFSNETCINLKKLSNGAIDFIALAIQLFHDATKNFPNHNNQCSHCFHYEEFKTKLANSLYQLATSNLDAMKEVSDFLFSILDKYQQNIPQASILNKQEVIRLFRDHINQLSRHHRSSNCLIGVSGFIFAAPIAFMLFLGVVGFSTKTVGGVVFGLAATVLFLTIIIGGPKFIYDEVKACKLRRAILKFLDEQENSIQLV